LNTFHKAGQNEKSVTQGVPRFQELLNATKQLRCVNCKIYFNEGNKSIQELRNTVNHEFACLTLNDISEKIVIRMDKKEESWYSIFTEVFNDRFQRHQHCVSIKVNKVILFKYRIYLRDIVDKIEEEYDDLHCVFSTEDVGQIDIFVDVSKIHFTESQLLFVTEENVHEIYMDECVLPKLKTMVLFGIEGIENIYFVNEKNEWILETDGSNFNKLLGHKLVAMEKLQSNSVWDIYDNLGIEAARKFLISEFESIMEGINISHVKLLVEKMTFTGTISSISRYTLRKDESGPLSKASFEESVEHMVKSAFAGDIEKTKGVSASIICGKRASIGTGVVDLKINTKKLIHAKPIFFTDNIISNE
jgi:DNA-directed RNA polymerase beta' subunit